MGLAGDYAELTSANPVLADLYATLGAMNELLALHTTYAKTKGRLQDRLAKSESDLDIAHKKIERLEDQLKIKEKKIGEQENNMHRLRGEKKNTSVKKKDDEVENYKTKVTRGQAGNLYEHEIKKKDSEIAKLKDTLKRSSMLHKDKIEVSTKYSRFELNNFYDGMEKDFNLLDSKKREVYANLVEESSDMRHTILLLLTEVNNLQAAVLARHGSNEPSAAFDPNQLSKPFGMVRDDIRMSCQSMINDIKKSVGLYAKIS